MKTIAAAIVPVCVVALLAGFCAAQMPEPNYDEVKVPAYVLPELWAAVPGFCRPALRHAVRFSPNVPNVADVPYGPAQAARPLRFLPVPAQLY